MLSVPDPPPSGPDDPRHVIGWAGLSAWGLLSLVQANAADGLGSTYPLLARQSGLSKRQVIRLAQRLADGGLLAVAQHWGRGQESVLTPGPLLAGKYDMGVTLNPASRQGIRAMSDMGVTPLTAEAEKCDTGVTLMSEDRGQKSVTPPPDNPPSMMRKKKNSSSSSLNSDALPALPRTGAWPRALGARYAAVVAKFATLDPELSDRRIEALFRDVEQTVGTPDPVALEAGLRSGWLVVERRLDAVEQGSAPPIGSLGSWMRSVLVQQIQEAVGGH